MYMVWGFLAGAVLAGLLFAVRNNGALAKLRAENADLRVENTKLTEEKNSVRNLPRWLPKFWTIKPRD